MLSIGTLTRPNKETYNGDWIKDSMNGKGIYTYANGDKYEGEWQNGLQHGEGIVYTKLQ